MGVHVFIMLLESRKFETIPKVSNRERTWESGDPIIWNGEDAVVLGSGLTRSESKKVGTQYYNRVCEIHGEDGDWTFDTQSFDQEQGRRSPDSQEDKGPARKRPRHR